MNKMPIKFNDKLRGINVDIELDRKYTIVFSNSGTYKSLLYEIIRDKGFNNVLCFNYDSKDADIAGSIYKKQSEYEGELLVIIDDADELFCKQPELIDTILFDTTTTKFLIYTNNFIFTHDASLWAQIKNDNAALKLQYRFSND